MSLTQVGTHYENADSPNRKRKWSAIESPRISIGLRYPALERNSVQIMLKVLEIFSHIWPGHGHEYTEVADLVVTEDLDKYRE